MLPDVTLYDFIKLLDSCPFSKPPCNQQNRGRLYIYNVRLNSGQFRVENVSIKSKYPSKMHDLELILLKNNEPALSKLAGH